VIPTSPRPSGRCGRRLTWSNRSSSTPAGHRAADVPSGVPWWQGSPQRPWPPSAAPDAEAMDEAAFGPPRDDPLRWWFAACRGSAQGGSSLSLELRWFGRGEPPPAVTAVRAGGRTETRTDHYALLDRDDVSIKLRGRSRLGIKQRRCLTTVADGLPPAERWSRRSARTQGRWVVTGPSWFPVTKRRARVLVDLRDGEPVVATGRRAALERGGAMEVVELAVPGGDLWWSVACETWGPSDRDGLGRLLEWPGVDWHLVDRSACLGAGYAAALRQGLLARPSDAG
jgi:hypothetical protein